MGDFALHDAMVDRERLEADYERTVREDIELFREKAEAYLAGQISEEEFRAFRLRRGIYGQRQPGVQMVRTKIPGGLLTAEQMEQLARVADEFGGGRAHLTTRQNVQFHFVPLRRVPALLHMLADARLTTREACYNTVRNVTCCPLAGLAADEAFDVRPYARQVAFAFLHKELTDNLPRKFKISFSACPEDCMAASIHDIGLRGVIRYENGQQRRGFRMLIGGGLGPLPCEAQLLDEFVPVERVVNKCEAVLRVFNQHGNRKNKFKARLKFVLRERGFDWVKEQVEKEYEQILEHGGILPPAAVPEGFGGFRSQPPPLGAGASLPVLDGNGQPDPDYERWLQTNVRQQKQAGYVAVSVRVDQGNLRSEQMRALARLARDAGDGSLRLTITQNVLLAFIAQHNLRRVYLALQQVGLAGAGVGQVEDITTCPGAYSCNLGLTKSMNLGAALQQMVSQYTDPAVRELSIKVSGCPNACGQHWIADLGFYGNSRKVDGREIPYYQMLLGGGRDEQGILRFGLAVQSIAAKLAPEAVRRVLDHYLAHRLDGETFRDYVLRHKVEFFRELTRDLAQPPELFPDLYKDWGDEVEFSLKLGRAECAA
ncbi:MAG: nitrite/sulfite reductase [Bryobacteraceae bacterium]|nr:nitrite/sulfite reductase [Bryobacteraceae bacterium]